VNIGRLNRRIRIEQRSTTQDSTYGTLAATWTTVGTFNANVEEVLPSKGESLSQGFNIAERPARVRMRYVDGITAAMRVIYIDRGNRVLKILTPPVELGRRAGMEFMVADFSTSGNAE
jgi:head-tail adaptor